MPAPFQIKICGITTVEDALNAVDAGADAIGLNFYERSSRSVTLEVAQEIAAAIYSRDASVQRVGVFVNASIEHILTAVGCVGLDAVQLHGDEPPSFLAELRRRSSAVIFLRAFRVKDSSLAPVRNFLNECRPQLPAAVLLDAYDPTAYGGTGKRLDWELVQRERAAVQSLPIVLAGGLTEENVAEAIATSRPDAVDVAGGVESAPGRKDPDKVRRFVAAAKMAFERLC